VHNSLGVVLAQLGRVGEARDRFQEALRLDPNVPGARNNLERAETLLRQGIPPNP
jgi:Flp pilus assembly protein TadD